MKQSSRSFPRWLWIGLTSLGLGLGIPLGFAVGIPAEFLFGMMLVVPAIGLVAGASLGASQSLVLRNRQVRTIAWVAATALGMAFGLTTGTVGIEVIGLRRGNPLEEAVSMVVLGLAVGISLGVPQWFVLRQHMARAAWWVAASVIGTAIGFLGGGLTAELLAGGFRSPTGLAVFALVGGALMALATTPVLRRMETNTARLSS